MAEPRVNNDGKKALDRAQESFDNFKTQVDAFNPLESKKPSMEVAPQTLKSSQEIRNMDAPYIKPSRSINTKEPFNEKFRVQRDRDHEYVKCIVENYETIGSPVETWTKKYPGDSAQFWIIPTNKPVYIPRMVAQQLCNCTYNKLSMEENSTYDRDARGTFQGTLVVEQTRARIDVRPVHDGKVGRF